MKTLPWILVGLLIGVIVWLFLRPHQSNPDEVKRDTVVVIDTVRDTIPIPYKVSFMRRDTVRLPAIHSDSIHADSMQIDSVPVIIPIEQKTYKDSLYTAWVSGYTAKLDSIEIYSQTNNIYIKERLRNHRFGIGIQAGYGYPNGWYIGVGVSYNLWKW